MNENGSRFGKMSSKVMLGQGKVDVQRQTGSEVLPLGPLTTNVKVVFEEFKRLYEDRLKRLQSGSEDCTQEEILQVPFC